MRASARAALDEVAHNRIVAAVAQLAAAAGVEFDPAMLTAQARDPEIRMLREREALADLLEVLAESGGTPGGGYVRLADLDEVEGVGPTTLRRIQEHFGGRSD